MGAEVSIIVPTRGDRPFLRRALESALAVQQDIELLLVHDRVAGAPELPADLRVDPRVRVSESRTPGPSAARNQGLTLAAGRYVAFLDDDDLFLPHHLARAREELEREASTTLVASQALVFRDPTPDGSGVPPPDGDGLSPLWPGGRSGPLTRGRLLAGNPIATGSVVLVRSRLAPEDRFDESLSNHEDQELWLRLARCGHRLRFDSTPGIVVRKRPDSQSRDRRRTAKSALTVLRRELAHGFPIGEVSRRTIRHREADLWHDLAYACLLEGDRAAARRAILRSAALSPTILKNYLYLAASVLPHPAWGRPSRRARGGRH